jgi:hypothetical protein
MSYMYDVSNPTYRDAGCPSQCNSMYEYATVKEMNGTAGAVPIPPSSQLRIFNAPVTVNANNQVVNTPAVTTPAEGFRIMP